MMLERYFAIAFVVVGLSHAVQPRMWVELFAALAKTGFAAPIIALFTLPQGLVIVVWHNTWGWHLPVILTVAGWGMTLKSLIYLVAPSRAEKTIAGAGSKEQSYRVVGVLMVVLGCLLGFSAFL